MESFRHQVNLPYCKAFIIIRNKKNITIGYYGVHLWPGKKNLDEYIWKPIDQNGNLRYIAFATNDGIMTPGNEKISATLKFVRDTIQVWEPAIGLQGFIQPALDDRGKSWKVVDHNYWLVATLEGISREHILTEEDYFYAGCAAILLNLNRF